MADWVDITDSQVDPDAPLTSDLAYAWRDNAIAITEAATGAPRIDPLANKVPRIFKGALAGTAYTSFIGLPSTMAAIEFNATLSTASAHFRIAFSTNNGASYGADQNITSATGSFPLFVSVIVDMVAGVVYGTIYNGGSLDTVGSISVPSGVNAIRFSSSASRVGFVVLRVISGVE